MKLNFRLFLFGVWLAGLLIGTRTASAAAGIGSSFKGPIGLQLYSLREQFKKDVPGTLDEVKSFGIQYAELAGTYNVAPEKFRSQLLDRGINPVSGHFPYEQFQKDPEGIAREAKALGL